MTEQNLEAMELAFIKRRMAWLEERLNQAQHMLIEWRKQEATDERTEQIVEALGELGYEIRFNGVSHHLCFQGQIIVVKCLYHKTEGHEGTHQCPACKKWCCDECYEMLLPIDNLFPQAETATMCSQCHYTTYATGGED